MHELGSLGGVPLIWFILAGVGGVLSLIVVAAYLLLPFWVGSLRTQVRTLAEHQRQLQLQLVALREVVHADLQAIAAELGHHPPNPALSVPPASATALTSGNRESLPPVPPQLPPAA